MKASWRLALSREHACPVVTLFQLANDYCQQQTPCSNFTQDPGQGFAYHDSPECPQNFLVAIKHTLGHYIVLLTLTTRKKLIHKRFHHFMRISRKSK